MMPSMARIRTEFREKLQLAMQSVSQSRSTVMHANEMESISYLTPYSFLCREPEQMAKLLDMTLGDVLQWRAKLAEQLRLEKHPNCDNLFISGSCSALHLYQKEKEDSCKRLVVSTGSSAFDGLVACQEQQQISVCTSTGLRGGLVYEVVGEPASGKTQLALSIVCRALVDTRGLATVYYLTSLGVSESAITRRISRLLDTHIHKNNTGISSPSEMHSKYTHQIHFVPVRDGYQLLSALTHIEGLDSQKLIVVLDSASGCLTTDSLSLQEAGPNVIAQVSMQLRQLARNSDSLVFVCNGTIPAPKYAGEDISLMKQGTLAPALKKYWRPHDVRVYLEITKSCNDFKYISATLTRHCLKSVNHAAVVFAICQTGVTDAA